ncbi:MAG: hypothetical protein B6I38_05345 [Anaerolineaceae bacterium 4572_5.1]|nr:MAG: hypothetical protein B5M51_03410 [Anaerolinea sp. 4484_236]OQY31789.1 MAG: hypothetical protein B6I38_05345 [Anaerolineaceae bacterium 4572_5.1]
MREIIAINPVLLAALLSWFLAQAVKIPIYYFQNGKWNFALIVASGGMPSSHSALVSATSYLIGLLYGFDTPLFAVATVTALIVIHDATGVRREAGRQAIAINSIIEDLARGKFAGQEKLREMLGHTPLEAFSGMFLGLGVAQLIWFLGR